MFLQSLLLPFSTPHLGNSKQYQNWISVEFRRHCFCWFFSIGWFLRNLSVIRIFCHLPHLGFKQHFLRTFYGRGGSGDPGGYIKWLWLFRSWIYLIRSGAKTRTWVSIFVLPLFQVATLALATKILWLIHRNLHKKWVDAPVPKIRLGSQKCSKMSLQSIEMSKSPQSRNVLHNHQQVNESPFFGMCWCVDVFWPADVLVVCW